MDPRHLFQDSRLLGCCVHCGGEPNTRDHAPSLVLLDEPLPNDLLVVEACRVCNNNFSKDEEYLACMLECVIHGSAELRYLSRPKVAHILSERPKLAQLIGRTSESTLFGERIVWRPDVKRVQNVILKLARAHIAYEIAYPKIEPPVIYDVRPVVEMSDNDLEEFERPLSVQGNINQPSPEIGTRSFLRAVDRWQNGEDERWIIVQKGRYRYRVDVTDEGNEVRIVLSEYLACHVCWA